jgi:hypothetical protein
MKRILLAVIMAGALLFGGGVFASDNQTYEDDQPAVIYQAYGGNWYEFRYDWRDYQLYPDDWDSVDELRAWLEYDDVPLVLTADGSGNIKFNGQCEDEAFQARDRAYDAGKRLDTEILSRAECVRYREYLLGNVYLLGPHDGHYLNKAVIGNEVWYVQASTDKIWKAYNLD